MYFNSRSALTIVPLTPTQSQQKPADTHTSNQSLILSLFSTSLSLIPHFSPIYFWIGFFSYL